MFTNAVLTYENASFHHFDLAKTGSGPLLGETVSVPQCTTV